MSSSTRGHFGLAILLAALATIGPFSIDTFLPAMPAIAKTLAVSPVQMQQTLTVYLLAYAVMMLWHGSISDAVGRRPVVLVTTLLFGVASLGCALADNLGTLLLFRALQGLCGGAGLVVGRAIIRDKLDGVAAQRLMSQVTMLFSLAPAFAPVVGGWLFQAFGWHAIFVFMALLGFVLFALCWFTLPETHHHSLRQPLQTKSLLANYRQVAGRREFQLLTAAVSFNFAGFFLYIPSAPVFLLQHLHLRPDQFLWMFGPSVLGIMSGAYLSGRMAGRVAPPDIVSRAYVIMFTAALLNLLYNLLAPQLSMPWAVLPLALYTMGMSLAAPSITLNLMDQFPALRGTASSLQGFFQTMMSSIVAGALAPLVWGSPLNLAVTMMLLLVLGFGFRMAYRRRIKQLARH
ncbi:multidrug effflux MFS transporter [Neisseriaceae bacterium TC5R-5]|nr:multidrug effflux MFS transporter [Neisseriaceae bacterium TC5R-5]